jgi:hypothetical protein
MLAASQKILSVFNIDEDMDFKSYYKECMLLNFRGVPIISYILRERVFLALNNLYYFADFLGQADPWTTKRYVASLLIGQKRLASARMDVLIQRPLETAAW